MDSVDKDSDGIIAIWELTPYFLRNGLPPIDEISKGDRISDPNDSSMLSVLDLDVTLVKDPPQIRPGAGPETPEEESLRMQNSPNTEVIIPDFLSILEAPLADKPPPRINPDPKVLAETNKAARAALSHMAWVPDFSNKDVTMPDVLESETIDAEADRLAKNELRKAGKLEEQKNNIEADEARDKLKAKKTYFADRAAQRIAYAKKMAERNKK